MQSRVEGGCYYYILLHRSAHEKEEEADIGGGRAKFVEFSIAQCIFAPLEKIFHKQICKVIQVISFPVYEVGIVVHTSFSPSFICFGSPFFLSVSRSLASSRSSSVIGRRTELRFCSWTSETKLERNNIEIAGKDENRTLLKWQTLEEATPYSNFLRLCWLQIRCFLFPTILFLSDKAMLCIKITNSRAARSLICLHVEFACDWRQVWRASDYRQGRPQKNAWNWRTRERNP